MRTSLPGSVQLQPGYSKRAFGACACARSGGYPCAHCDFLGPSIGMATNLHRQVAFSLHRRTRAVCRAVPVISCIAHASSVYDITVPNSVAASFFPRVAFVESLLYSKALLWSASDSHNLKTWGGKQDRNNKCFLLRNQLRNHPGMVVGIVTQGMHNTPSGRWEGPANQRAEK